MAFGFETSFGSAFNQPSSGAFWTSWDTAAAGLAPPPALGATVQRLNDRLFVGGATLNSGDFPSTTKDKLEAFEASRSDPRGFRTSWSQFASVATNGGIGVLGAAFSSDSPYTGLQLGIGGCFLSLNDNTAQQQLVTAMYAVAWRLPGAGVGVNRGTVGGEVDIVNEGNTVQITPGNLYPSTGFTTAFQIASGALSPYAVSASAALTIGNNGANFLSGLVFGRNAIAGLAYDGNGQAIGGAGSAMRLSAFQQQEWWVYPYSAPSFVISSRQITPRTDPVTITATDQGLELGGNTGLGLGMKVLYPGGATGAYLALNPAFGTTPLTLAAEGQTNADLRLRAKGTGTIVLGLDSVPQYANDAAAGAGGVNPGGVYRDASFNLKIKAA